MSQFPWETSTGASQIFQASTRIPSGPMAGRYNQREVNRSPRRTDPYQRQPRPPHSRNVDPLHDHPRGKREWEQFEERTVPTIKLLMDSPIDGRHLIVQLSSLIWLAQIDAIKKNRADCTNVAKMNQKQSPYPSNFHTVLPIQ